MSLEATLHPTVIPGFVLTSSSVFLSLLSLGLPGQQQHPQPVREWHQLGPSGGPLGFRLPPGLVRLPAWTDRLPGPGDPLRGRLHAASLHCPVDRAEGRLGGSPGLGQRPHQERVSCSGCGSVGSVCGTKILQVMTPGGALWGSS
ncbi:BCL2 antagonist/killer 1 [Phyllostomus discolor]|uniref:BCL2 antagonist/killer 1 n=1 Tax=Phyllostomus discolor TaxID=89673 RepID=A0A834AKA8_9CHIR|nr:BCL2 antagonist/killer 1 [Phyllostomus discolor]